MSGFGVRLRTARQKKGFTLEKLGELVGSSKAYIWQLENKDTATPSADLLMKLCAALDVLPGVLLEGSRQPVDAEFEKDVLYRKFESLGERDKDIIRSMLEQMNASKGSPQSGS